MSGRTGEDPLRMEDRDGTLMSVVDFGGVQKDVCLQYIPDAPVGRIRGGACRLRDSASSMRNRRFRRWPSSSASGVLNEEFGDGFELAAKQAGLSNPEQAARTNGIPR